MMNITTTVTIDEGILEKLDYLAKGDGRTRSNMLNKLLMDLFSEEDKADEKDM